MAAVSHELRTPLTCIVGLASELADRTDIPEGERRTMLHVVAEQAFDMASIVDDLLVASGEDGQIVIALDVVKLGEVTRAYVEQLGARFHSLGGRACDRGSRPGAGSPGGAQPRQQRM